MSTAPMTEIVDAFYLCLAASVIWAPLVFIGAAFFNRRYSGRAEASIWPSALLIAALPVVAAPVAAAFGLSLRTAKPLPPMAAPEAYVIAAPVTADIVVRPGPAIELATVINAVADLYFYGFILFAALGVLRLAGFSYRIRYSYPIDDTRLMDGLNDWRRRIGVSSPVRFAYSDAVTSVCVHGFVRPVVLMPPSLLERISTNDAILMGAHELAHVKRGDTWLFAFCSLAKALFWFNPFMRRIVAHAQLAAEQAADALVIRRGVNRKSYARCFVESLKMSSGLSAPQHALVPSFTPFDKRSRRERLDAILSGRAASPVLTLGGKIVLIASGLLALVLAFGQAALAVAPPPAKVALTVVPVDGRVTSNYGERIHPVTKEPTFHSGMDIAAPTGTVVRAAGGGKVTAATSRYNDSDAWGNVVVIDHGHGLVTRYAQLDSYIVRKGDSVKAGDTIGAVGATGKYATGPHLHFEVLADGENIDPAPVVTPDAPVAPTPRRIKKVNLAPAAPGVVIEAAPPAPAPIVEPVDLVAAPDVEFSNSPASEPMPAPDVPVAPEPTVEPLEIKDLPIGERFELKFAGGLAEWAENLEDGFAHFEWPDAEIVAKDGKRFVVKIGDIELDGFGNAEELAEALSDINLEFDSWPNVTFTAPNFAFAIDGEEFTDEEREAMERAHEKAQRAAEKERRKAERRIERMQRDFDRAQQQRENAQEHIEHIERERASAIAKAESKIHDREFSDRMNAEHMEEMLRLREEALSEAAEALAEERAELEQLRAELEAEKRNQD